MMRTKSDANKRNNTRTPRPPPSNIGDHSRFRDSSSGDVSGKIKFRCSEKREGESSSRLYSVISSSSRRRRRPKIVLDF